MSLSALVDDISSPEAPTMPISKRTAWLNGAFVVSLTVLYVLLFLLLFKSYGDSVTTLVMGPVVAAGWLFGTTGGLVAWAASTLLNTILLNVFDPSPTSPFGWDAVLAHNGGMGTFTLMLVTAAVGRMSDLYEQARTTLAQQQHDATVPKPHVDECPAEIQSRIDSLNEKVAERDRHIVQLRELLENERLIGETRARFGTFVSHEFRTPLAMIQSSNDLLKNYGERLTERRKAELLDTIQVQIIHLNELLEDILTVSKIERRGLSSIDYDPQPIDADALFRDVAVETQRASEETHTIIYTRTGSNRSVNMDRKLMRRVIVNLLSNAIKYSPYGGVVQLELCYETDHMILRVSDHGIGIPPSDLKFLFETFRRGSNVGSIPGTGLGLALTRHAITAHGGTIEVESTIGEGTTFIVRIPFDVPPA
jgi:signal transduction histidine kinase